MKYECRISPKNLVLHAIDQFQDFFHYLFRKQAILRDRKFV
jgi:hypothetical protein